MRLTLASMARARADYPPASGVCQTAAVGTNDEALVLSWLREEGLAQLSPEPLAGDVSARRYFRSEGEDGSSVIAVSYPPDQLGACRRFVATTRLLSEAGIDVPEILAVDLERGLMAVQDAGPRTLHEVARGEWRRIDPWYPEAVRVARRIAELPTPVVAELNPPLDAASLRWELGQTVASFLRPTGRCESLGLDAVEELFDEICRRLTDDLPVPGHRDFMVRNLIPAQGTGGLVVLDHQDLRLVPPDYDLASLLNDTLFPDPKRVAELLGAAPTERLHRTAAQRCLKAVGTYARAAERGNRRHLPLVRPTLERAVGHLGELPEAADRIRRIESSWLC